MPTFNLSNKIKIVNPVADIDEDYGVYNSVSLAEAAIPLALRKGGKTVGIWEVGKVVEYWWKDDTGTPLVKKNPPLVSASLLVTTPTDGSEVRIELPEISSIPALIVNSDYIPTYDEFMAGKTKGDGTAARPFTNTITYTTPTVYTVVENAIQNALDAYQGSGGKGITTELEQDGDPQLLGSIIQIEKAQTPYYFSGNLDYLGVNIKVKSGAVISTNTSEWLMDFTKFAPTKSHNPVIDIEDGAYIFCNKNGFKLVSADFPQGSIYKKRLRIIGGAKNTGIVLNGDLESYILFEVNGAGQSTVLNGGFENLALNSFVATRQGIMFSVKGNGIVVTNDARIYFITDKTVATTNTYPVIRIENTGLISIVDSTVELGRTNSTIYTQLVAMKDNSNFEAINSTFKGTATYFVKNTDVSNTSGVRMDGCKNYLDTDTNSGYFANTTSGVWSNFVLTNNNMPFTKINPANTILTPSSINTIGGKVVETLDTYYTKASAIAAGIPSGGKFIKRTDVGAVNLVAGVEYKVTTVGDPALGALNTYFTATGSETGIGVGTLYQIDIVA